jgi:hypothetical protein
MAELPFGISVENKAEIELTNYFNEGCIRKGVRDFV